MGNPDPAKICTSHVERQNLTIRIQMRRLTRLTNAFSKKWENLWAAYCLHFAYYNFCRIHKTPRVTPAMESNLTDHVWDLAEFIGLESRGRNHKKGKGPIRTWALPNSVWGRTQIIRWRCAQMQVSERRSLIVQRDMDLTRQLLLRIEQDSTLDGTQ